MRPPRNTLGTGDAHMGSRLAGQSKKSATIVQERNARAPSSLSKLAQASAEAPTSTSVTASRSTLPERGLEELKLPTSSWTEDASIGVMASQTLGVEALLAVGVAMGVELGLGGGLGLFFGA